MGLLRGQQRLLARHLSAKILRRLLVSQRRQRPRRFAVSLQQTLGLFDQPRVKHLLRPPVDALIQSFAVGIEPQTQDSKSLQRLPALLPHVGHLLARAQANFNGADYFGRIVGVNFFRRRTVKPAQNSMKVTRSTPLHSLAQPFAQLLGTLRPGEEPIQQRTQIKSGSAHNDRQMSTLVNFLQHLPRLPRILSGRDMPRRIDAIHQMMPSTRSFGSGRLGRANIELAVHGDRIAVHDLALKTFSQRQRERGLAAGRGAEHYRQQWLRLH